MTGPDVPMSQSSGHAAPTDRDRATRDRLAEVLFRIDTENHLGLAGMSYEAAAERLLPVVAELVREGQAEVLEAAADGIGDWPGVGNAIRSSLRDRAAVLRAPRAGGAA